MRLTVLVDHEASRPGLRTEWGASVYVETGQRSILFDMGATGLFAENARALGVAVEDADFGVISHHHWDHGGGLARFLRDNTAAPVWLSAHTGADLFLKVGPIRRPVGIDAALLAEHRDRLRLVTDAAEPAPGIHLLTDIPVVHPLPRGNRFLVRRTDAGLVRDDFRHELAVVIEEQDGLVLLTGCSHHGVLNMVEAARKAFPGRALKAVVGGFHFIGIPIGGLFGDTRAAIREVAERLRAAGIPRIITMHCTERRGYEILRGVIGPGVEYAGVGASLRL